MVGPVLSGAVALFPVYVRPDGIRGYNFFGSYRTLPWDDIGVVWPVNLLGLRYLILADVGQRHSVWVPLYLTDMRRFARAVRDRLPGVHPLAEALSKYDR